MEQVEQNIANLLLEYFNYLLKDSYPHTFGPRDYNIQVNKTFPTTGILYPPNSCRLRCTHSPPAWGIPLPFIFDSYSEGGIGYIPTETCLKIRVTNQFVLEKIAGLDRVTLASKNTWQLRDVECVQLKCLHSPDSL